MVRNSLIHSASIAALGVAIAVPTALNAQAAEQKTDTSEIVVTASSRITTAGFQAPTPTTVIGQLELRQGGRTDIQAALADLPEVRQTQNAATTNTTTNSGQAPADIRGLGSSRTLVLVNGHRFVSSDDLQTIPFSLTKEVNVVTGGASAAYGSDAVAGVVNIVLDDNFKGLKLDVQSGISSRGDGAKQYYSAAWGGKLTDRWHVMIGADYMNDHGVQPGISRPRIGATAFVAGTDGLLHPTQNVVQADRSLGGLIVSGALTGQTFNNDGTIRPFQFGRRVGTLMVGGEGYNTDFNRSVLSPLERVTVYGRTTYEISNSFKLWAEANYAKTSNERDFFPDLAPSGTAYTYFTANPYLPAAVRNQLTAAGQTSFTMTRVLTDLAEARYRFDRQVREGTAGFSGNIGSHWRYNGYYTHGEQTQDLQLKNIIKNAEFRNAIDVVTGPNGTPVCRVALTNPTTACQPLNLFGQNNFSQAAHDYVTGTWHSIQKTWLDNAALSISGEPFQIWNRPVAFAAGAEWRKQATQTTYDPVSNAGGFATINGTNTPKRGNNVKEAFVEVGAPVLADLPFVEELTFNGAARVSKYSTFGKAIWSWKVGAVWKVNDDIKLRATRSRDIRAANLTELYTNPGTLFSPVNDISKPVGQQAVTAILRTGGNPNLAPEKADTLAAGVVLTPRPLRGLSLSVDYYKIKIANVITTLSAQQIINACYLQNVAAACSQLTRNSAGVLTDIFAAYINVAKFDTSGFDIEGTYRTRTDKIGLPGQLTFRALANHVDHLISDNGVLRVDGAGFAGSQATYLTPKWRANGSITYESKKIGADVRVRWLSASGYAPASILAGVAPGDNHISAYTYVDLGLRTYVPFGGDMGHRLTIYGSISNLFDKQPPIAATSTPYYDIMGRYFSMGATFRF